MDASRRPGRADDAGSRLVGAQKTWDRAVAVNDWLNAHVVPDRHDQDEIRRDLRSARVPAPGAPTVDLPCSPGSPAMTLVDALRHRYSNHEYAARPISAVTLGDVLRRAVGLGRRVSAYGRTDYPLSVAPSGGGLNSVVVHVAIRDVTGVPTGIYRYEFITHSLSPLVCGDPTGALRDVYLQEDFAAAPVSLLLVGRLRRVLAKYPLRHYRVLHIDTGIVIQNLYLVSTAIGLSCCAVTGYRDGAVTEILGLDEGSIPTALFAMGYPPELSDG